ncbi:hypothetical protein PGT21_010672 [Puccinia graminis f. sp. tritici]|uniref:Secreted protein n=1 Tax=Puccinia graminis f. sp. tritici TaxID=56615 RepID=A0A5B0NFL6_PUCGR|nr:hypothetical protein PGT21_010672 [Puccinia graminis f. sp. tritici]
MRVVVVIFLAISYIGQRSSVFWRLIHCLEAGCDPSKQFQGDCPPSRVQVYPADVLPGRRSSRCGVLKPAPITDVEMTCLLQRRHD